MKAIRIHEFGNTDVLRYEDAPIPTIAPDDVLIRVVAASVNGLDWKIREGWLEQMHPHSLPLTLGWDLSGVVEAVGEQVTRFKVGEAVYAYPDTGRNGAYAEYVAVRESEVAHKPATISHVEAAALPMTGTTAWTALIKVAQLTVGQRVLIHAAAGGVGTLAVQLAKWRGAYVVATASAKNRALVASLGADEVIDYHATPFKEVVRDIDVVLDPLGGQTQEDSWSGLKPGGLLVSLVQPPAAERAQALGVRGTFVLTLPDVTVLEQLAGLVDNGHVRPVIGAEFALKDVAQAHALSQSGHTKGKIVLYVGQP